MKEIQQQERSPNSKLEDTPPSITTQWSDTSTPYSNGQLLESRSRHCSSKAAQATLTDVVALVVLCSSCLPASALPSYNSLLPSTLVRLDTVFKIPVTASLATLLAVLEEDELTPLTAD